MKKLFIFALLALGVASCENIKPTERQTPPIKIDTIINQAEPLVIQPYWNTNDEKEQTRGVRNNNPSNIKRSNADWVGLDTMHTDSTYCEFVSMDYGVRALIKLLVNYDKKGVNTPVKIVSRFASGRDYYINHVCRVVGVTKNERINMNSHDTFYLLCKAICKIESGFYLERSLFNRAHRLV